MRRRGRDWTIFHGSMRRSGLNQSLAAVAMVLCWSSGFLVAKAASPFSEIGVFLLLRFSIAVCFFTVLSAVSRATWPSREHFLLHCLSGALLQGGYLVAGYRAVETGLSVGAMTLIGAFQPTITAVVVSLLSGSPPRVLVWQGLLVGTLGVFMVLGPQFSAADQEANWVGYSAAAIAVVSVTLGTLLQSKLLNQCDLAPAGALQNIGAAAVALSAATFWDLWSWSSHPVLWISLFWASMGLSVGGYALLLWLLRSQDIVSVTSLVLSTPPIAAASSFIIFGETLTPAQITGMAVSIVGVVIVRRSLQQPPGKI
ncbi:DMT family transporter [Agrobacterium vitis]|uniref:EamA family transporter n=2 Tax=Agrobacterium vitis TaxID=373 RepID=A0AAE4WCV6_AGRVI|nr:DMT family transporter [Allorhizobium sp. Av2]MCM2439449.1 DMT family transporter [Agrobacterium vitis]MUZ57650.1 EamA family transporter [Agrobacterium vitis]